MTHPAQSIPARPEIEIHARQIERNAEDRKLIVLKARLLDAIRKQQPSPLARAS